jgi:hypothetical protein
MGRLHTLGLIVAVVLAFLPAPAGAASPRAGLGIDYFTGPDGQRNEISTGLSGMAETLLSDLLANPIYKACRHEQIEVKRQAERQRELALGRSDAVDPATRVQDRSIPLRHLITGSTLNDATGASFSISLVDVETSAILGSVIGRGNNLSELEASLRQALSELVEKLCPRAVRMKVQTGPYFVIDSEVCDISKPFTVRPKGGFAGVALQFKPASRGGGTFTQGGRAFGTNWTGGGTYSIAWSGDVGRFEASDSYAAENQAGRADSPNDRMIGTMTRLPKICAK